MAVPAAKAGRWPGSSPRLRRRKPFSAAAADDHRQRHRAREHVGVLAGEAAPAGDRQGRPVARDPGRQRGRLRQAQRQAVGGVGAAAHPALRPAVGQRHRRRRPQAVPGRVGSGPPRRRSIWRSRASPIAAAGQKGERQDLGLAAVERAQLLGDHAALADQQGQGGARRAVRPRSSSAARGRAAPSPSRPAREPGSGAPSWRPAAARSGPAPPPARPRARAEWSVSRQAPRRPRAPGNQPSVAGETSPSRSALLLRHLTKAQTASAIRPATTT